MFMLLIFLFCVVFIETTMLAYMLGRNLTVKQEYEMIKEEVIIQGKAIVKLANSFKPFYEKSKKSSQG